MQRQTPLSLPIIRSRREQHAHVSHTASCIKVRELASKRKKKRHGLLQCVVVLFLIDEPFFYLWAEWTFPLLGKFLNAFFFFFSVPNLCVDFCQQSSFCILLFSQQPRRAKKIKKKNTKSMGVALQTWTKCAQERTCSEQARLLQTNAHKWQVREGNRSRKMSQSTMIRSPKKATQSHTQTVSGTNARKPLPLPPTINNMKCTLHFCEQMAMGTRRSYHHLMTSRIL